MSEFRSNFDPDHESETTQPSSLWSGDYPHPDTWPRRATERFQPRSRLHQALDVAQRIIETPQEPWARAVTPAREQLPEPARAHHEPTLFARNPVASATTPLPAAVASTEDPSSTADGGASSNVADPGDVATLVEDPGDVATLVEDPGAGAGGGGSPDEPVTPLPPPAAPSSRDDSAVFGPGGAPGATALRRAGDHVDEEPLHMVVDLRPVHEQRGPAPHRSVTGDFGLGSRWGAGWQASAQGWVRTAAGEPVWRPVVATTGTLPQWEIDTYLGIVTAEVAVEAQGGNFQQLGSTLARGRSVGMDGLVEESIERGAHAVIGVSMDYTPIGGRLLITITGTAVTLRQKPV